jgi:hypothetical protein
VALNLLTGMPLWAGVLVTAADVFIVLLFELRSFRILVWGGGAQVAGVYVDVDSSQHTFREAGARALPAAHLAATSSRQQ